MNDILALIGKAEQSFAEATAALQEIGQTIGQFPDLEKRVAVLLVERDKAATLFANRKLKFLMRRYESRGF